MRRLRALGPARLGASCLALLGAALAGAAIGALLHKPSASRSPAAPLASQTASAARPSSLLRARLRTAVTHLDSVRRPMRDRLASARTAADRAEAADAVAVAYRDAARMLAPLEPDRAAQSVPTVLLMRQLQRDYSALARAASANAAAAFASTGASISEHERALEGALARWRPAA
ncbi:MAG TPA: hypothetical protein VK501_18605 [Baekduia sp.]|uniref:hypothetical protein n=1 Tax=Baekduia sp. TaxID=2600305 RepID=UPI002D0AA6F1|nr:hypothetical protein [Baekduia sp.]HMJ35922.1 hypothetical protein [Baekduia sp.]